MLLENVFRYLFDSFLNNFVHFLLFVILTCIGVCLQTLKSSNNTYYSTSAKCCINKFIGKSRIIIIVFSSKTDFILSLETETIQERDQSRLSVSKGTGDTTNLS